MDKIKVFFKAIAVNGIVRMIFALTMVGVFSGLTLVFVYKYSIPKIQVNMNADTDRAIRELFPGADKVEKMNKANSDGIYALSDKTGKDLGYAFIAEGNGYQGIIKLIVGVDNSIKTMTGIEVLESQETPGLGAEISLPPFKDQFKGLALTHAIEYLKNEKPDNPYEIEAITGATISSRAVVNILNKGVATLREELAK